MRCRSGPPLLADAGRCKHPSPPGWEALMSEAYDGREIVGMDLHRRRSVLVRMTPDGRKLETTRITNSPAELRRVIAPAEIRELRELTRYRIKLVRLRTSCKDQVHAVLAKLGIPVTCTDIFGVWGNTWLDGLELGQPYAGKVASLRTLAGELTAEITVLEAAIADLLARHDGYHAIRALPGIGPVLGAVLVAEIGDITRFATPARLCSWAGLTPRQRESDTKVSRGHITKQGSPLVRWALVEAIQHVPAGHPLRRRKEDILARRGAQAKNIAKIAAARQLLTWVFYAMRDGQVRALATATQKAA